jgi:hypothetical protein
VVSGIIEGPEGFRLSGVFTYGSPLPFNVVTGTDRNNDTTVNDRPVGVGRNSERGFSFTSVDLRLSKRFRLERERAIELIAESFNTLNHANYQLPNNTFGPGTEPRAGFGTPTQAADSRQIQLAVRLEF